MQSSFYCMWKGIPLPSRAGTQIPPKNFQQRKTDLNQVRAYLRSHRHSCPRAEGKAALAAEPFSAPKPLLAHLPKSNFPKKFRNKQSFSPLYSLYFHRHSTTYEALWQTVSRWAIQPFLSKSLKWTTWKSKFNRLEYHRVMICTST